MNTEQNKFIKGQSTFIVKKILEKDLDNFASATEDFNPLHFDENFANKSRFEGRIVHGILILGLISGVIGTKLPGKGSIYLKQSVKFLHPVRINDEIKAIVEVEEWISEKNILILKTFCENQNNVIVLDGQATVLIN